MTDHPWSLQREARLLAREQALDPHNLLPEERRCRAEALDRQYFREIGRKSGEVRRERAARLKLLEQQAIERAMTS